MEWIFYEINIWDDWFYDIIVLNVYNFYFKFKDISKLDIIVTNLYKINIYI